MPRPLPALASCRQIWNNGYSFQVTAKRGNSRVMRDVDEPSHDFKHEENQTRLSEDLASETADKKHDPLGEAIRRSWSPLRAASDNVFAVAPHEPCSGEEGAEKSGQAPDLRRVITIHPSDGTHSGDSKLPTQIRITRYETQPQTKSLGPDDTSGPNGSAINSEPVTASLQEYRSFYRPRLTQYESKLQSALDQTSITDDGEVTGSSGEAEQRRRTRNARTNEISSASRGRKHQAELAAKRKALAKSEEEHWKPFAPPGPPTNDEIATFLDTIRENFQEKVGDDDGGATFDFKQLPLSPLMHPQLIKARTRYLGRKPLPSKDLSLFEDQLLKNPYAILLSTPIRACTLTGLRMPSSLLLPFGLHIHPVTYKPWQVPLAFYPEPKEFSYLNHSTRNPSPLELGDGIPSAGAETKPRPNAVETANQVRSRSYLVSTYPALSYLSKLPHRQFARTLPLRWRTSLSISQKDVVFRKDMADFVLELMRKKLVRNLAWLMDMDKKYVSRWLGLGRSERWLRVTPLDASDFDALNHGDNGLKQAAAVLWFGRHVISEDESPAVTEQIASFYEERKQKLLGEKTQGMYLIDDGTKLVPAFDMTALLGHEDFWWLRKLRPESSPYRNAAVVVKAKKASSKAVEWLWKLNTYLGDGIANPAVDATAVRSEYTTGTLMKEVSADESEDTTGPLTKEVPADEGDRMSSDVVGSLTVGGSESMNIP